MDGLSPPSAPNADRVRANTEVSLPGRLLNFSEVTPHGPHPFPAAQPRMAAPGVRTGRRGRGVRAALAVGRPLRVRGRVLGQVDARAPEPAAARAGANRLLLLHRL